MAFLNENGLKHLRDLIFEKLASKVDKIEGKGLSTNDFTTEEKEKLANLNTIIVDSSLDSTSINPVENKAVYKALEIVDSNASKTENKIYQSSDVINNRIDNLLIETTEADIQALFN